MLKVEEGKTNYGVRLITTEPLSRGRMFFRIASFRPTNGPTYQTIQIAAEQHIEELGVIAHLNHSCRPNALVHTGLLACFAMRDIAAGEELTFFYPSTEWEMARPFDCQCGAEDCIGRVAGARYTPIAVLSRYFINEHIRVLAGLTLESTEGQFAALDPQPVR